MPEGPEIERELERVHESIEEERAEARESGRFLHAVALSTAIIAVVAALASLMAGDTVNEALLQKNEAIARRTSAFDQWSYYQAKGIKKVTVESELRTLRALGKEPDAATGAEIARYAKEQADAAAKARALETASEERERDAERLLSRHHRYAFAVTLLQIAVALSAIAALSRSRSVWGLSLLSAAVGAVLFANGFALWF